MKSMLRYLQPLRTINQLQRQLAELSRDVTKLRRENASMRAGMRRCVTCEYRIECKNRKAIDRQLQT